MWDALEAVDLTEKGLPPVLAGSQEQARPFILVLRLARAEEAQVEREAKQRRGRG